MKIESHDISLEKLLQGNYFVIPKFQRPYSWESDQLLEFWTDINNVEKGDSYFIGSMVVYNTSSGKLAVVDGQQRLTTISIFLSAIRDQFLELGNEDSAEGLQQFIERKNVDNQKVYVLETESSYPYLQDQVFNFGEPQIEPEIGKEEKAISLAYDTFKKGIAEKVSQLLSDPTVSDSDTRQKDALDWLRSLRQVLLNLSIILVTLDDEDDAYLIFETLNTRGKDLALSDLLKNHFVRHLKTKSSVDAAKLKWEKLLDTIHSSEVELDPDNFIVHSWQSRYDMVTKGKAFKKIRSAITRPKAKEHLDMFLKDVGLWRAIFEPSFKFSKREREVLRSLIALREFRVVQPVPGLLSLLRSYENKKIKYKKLRDTLEAIENFHFSFTAVTSSRSSGGISGMYSSFGRKLFEADDPKTAANEISDLVEKLRQRVPAPTEFDASFGQLIYTKYNTSHRTTVRYALKKIALHEKQPTLGESEDLTIEHLLPQSEINNGIDADVVGQIGNLILVDRKTNEKLGEKSFPEKKTVLSNAGYVLPEIFKGTQEITPELIQQNTQRLSELAREGIWKV